MALRLSPAHIQGLQSGGAMILENVLGAEHASQVLAAAKRLQPDMIPAQVGHGEASRVDRSIRSDSISFVDSSAVPEGMERLWLWFRALRGAFVAAELEGVDRFRVQVACYPGDGAYYSRHLDGVGRGAQRRITVVYYPNTDWKRELGGALRLYTPTGQLDVLPEQDVAVVFLSEKVPHEVLPAWATRFAVTAWYAGPPDPLA